MAIDVVIHNRSDIDLATSRLQINVFEAQHHTGQLIEIVTLRTMDESSAVEGTTVELAKNTQTNSLRFVSTENLPHRIEALMQNPSGLIFRLGYYEVSDSLDREYRFSDGLSETTADDLNAIDKGISGLLTEGRTASVSIDYGDAQRAERFLVAVNGAVDSLALADQYDAMNGGYVGGFDTESGDALGLPLAYVLANILGLQAYDSKYDYIIAGSNGIFDSSAEGGVLQGLSLIHI